MATNPIDFGAVFQPVGLHTLEQVLLPAWKDELPSL